MNEVVTGSPLKRYSLSIVFFIIITVAVFSILVKLGLWQLDRAQKKNQWQQTLSERQQRSQLSFAQLQSLITEQSHLNNEFASLTGYQVKLSATPVAQTVILLDNQVYQGQVGYLALQAFSVEVGQPWILVELGFTPASKDRRELPKIQPLSQLPITIEGRIYQKQLNVVSHQLMAELSQPMRIQNLNIGELEHVLKHPILPTVLQPNALPEISLPHPWQPIPLSAQKHQGYALQWFTMAGVFLCLMLWIAAKFTRRQRPIVTQQHAKEERV
ncbi:SURF1 family protein [Shewanella maritima]|uniref:SURF1 family protein n=1 Tax=Shewanella maritima TaxID=2520507 RepID=UPI003736DB4B